MGLSKLFSRFSKGDKDKGLNNNHGYGQCVGDKGKLCQCRVLFLDDADLCLDVRTGAKGHLLLKRVFDFLNLVEIDYFGLRYLDATNQTHWLDPSKTVSSQLKTLPPHTLYFGVKFYAADPCKLREELTRYQFFLQVKRDILQGRLPVQFDLSVELAALAIQSELGDFDEKRHGFDYVSEFRFIPNQTEDFEDRVSHVHKTLTGIVPAAAEYRLLDKSKWLDMYGVDLHPVQGESNLEYFLGLTPTGIVVFRNKAKVGNYFWPRLSKVTFKGKDFMIRVKDRNKDEKTYAFVCTSKPACKHLWKCCVEHHAFFRLTSSNESYSATGRFLIFGSKHRYSGRTEKEALAESANRPPPAVVRKPSKRHARRRSAESLPNGYVGHRDPGDIIVMGPSAEPNGRDRGYQSAPESPRSARSVPWDNNRHSNGGLFTSGRSSPTSEFSDRMLFPRRQLESESEGGAQRRSHRSRMEVSDSEAEYRSTCRVPAEYTDASESESEFRKHRKYRKSLENVAPHESAWNEQQKRIRDGGYQGPFTLRPNGSMTSVASGESTASRRRRRRSKSPGNRKPPEQLAEHFKYVDPSQEGIPEDNLRDIAYTTVAANTDPALKAKAHRRARSKSPRNKHNENAEKLAAAAVSGSRSAPINAIPPVGGGIPADAAPPPYIEGNRSPAKSNASRNSQYTEGNRSPAKSTASRNSQAESMLHPPIQPVYGTQRTYAQPQPQSPYNSQMGGQYRVPQPADYSGHNQGHRSNYAKASSTSLQSHYSQAPSYALNGQSMYNSKTHQQTTHHEHVREDSGLGIESNPSSIQGYSPYSQSSHASYRNSYPNTPPRYQQYQNSRSPYTQQSPYSAQGSPASYNSQVNHQHLNYPTHQSTVSQYPTNGYPGSHQSSYASRQPLHVSNQPSYAHAQYTEQGISKTGAYNSNYRGNQLQVHNQQPSLYQQQQQQQQMGPNSSNMYYAERQSNGGIIGSGIYGQDNNNTGPPINVASTRRIYKSPQTTSSGGFVGQGSYSPRGATASEKTTEL